MMQRLSEEQLRILRGGLAVANPGLEPKQLDSYLEAIQRQHEDPEEHDRSLIAACLAKTPTDRLRDMQAFLDFVERARPTSPPSR